METKIRKLEPWLVVLGLAALLAVGVSVIHSFDVFWQLQSGRYMVETGAVIDKDTFTLISDAPRAEHCWLHDIILYGIFLVAGYAGISVWKGCMIVGTVVLLILAARVRSSSWLSILYVLPLVTLTSGGWLERPQLWTFLFFALFVLLLELYKKKRNNIVMLLIPAMVVWTNVHAGAVLGLAVLAAYLSGEFFTDIVKEKKLNFSYWKKLVFCSALVVVGGLVNPNTTQFLKTLVGAPGLGTTIDESGQVTGPVAQMFNMDWNSTSFATDPVFYYMMGAVATVFLVTYKRVKISDVFLLAGLALMGQSLIRHVPFFYFGCVAILPRYFDLIGVVLSERLPAFLQLTSRVFLLCVVLPLFWFLYQPVYNVYGAFNTGLREWHYPIEATRFVEENNLPANLYNTYDWGGYIAWELFPDYNVFWDGRQNSVEMFQMGWNVMAGKADWEKTLDDFTVNTIVTRASTIDTGQKYPLLDRLRVHNGWSLVFTSESSLVFVRNESVSSNWLLKYKMLKERMDDTILSEAHLMVGVNPGRYMAWWEMAQIYLKRKRYKEAFYALRQYLQRSPMPHPQAKAYYNQLSRMFNQ